MYSDDFKFIVIGVCIVLIKIEDLYLRFFIVVYFLLILYIIYFFLC